ncbi:MAG: putative small secreted protein [Verrucomicrobiales bacterium]|jgi:predicted small secreted protein
MTRLRRTPVMHFARGSRTNSRESHDRPSQNSEKTRVWRLACELQLNESMKAKSLKAIIAVLASIAVAMGTLTSCSTTEGFGRDLQKLGSEIEQEANEHH